jgi:YegS/Rv2252/BmrU family lipid kinase
MADHWLIVANPISGQGRAMHHRREIEAVLQRHGIDFSFEISEHPGHTTELAQAAIERGCRHVLAVGGDGTVNEAANGIFRQQAVPTTEITLGVLPIGTGNDWARAHRVPKEYSEVAALMRHGASRLHDVGAADFADGGVRRFINVAGIGFDAHVVAGMPDRTLGPLAYLAGLARGLLTFRPVPVTLRADGKTLSGPVFDVFICIGHYCGGGMMVAPLAKVDDGIFDITLIQELSRWEVLKSLRRLFDGTLLAHPKVLALRSTEASVESPASLPVEADGELIGRTPVRFTILPRALRVLAPPQ